MKNTTDIASLLLRASPSPLRSRAWVLLLTAAAILTPLLLSTANSSFAGSATWLASPVSGDWNNAANWTPGGPPDGPADTATFQSSNITSVSTSAPTEVNGIVFNAGASPFTITARPFLKELDITGVGITNNSGIPQNFVANGDGNSVASILFKNSATAGSLTAFTNTGGTFANAVGGVTGFVNTSTAGNGTFTTNGGLVSGAHGGAIAFGNSATAGNAIFTTNGAAVSGADGGIISFTDISTAGNGTFITNGGSFGGGGGMVQFSISSTGGTARMEIFGNGSLDMSFRQAPGMPIGSIEGSGAVFLGANNLTVGNNNLSTAFSGVIQDGGLNGGIGGSVTKIGGGKLTLSGANIYTGGTTISGSSNGTLFVTNRRGSGTGSGAVQVNVGKLGGTGKISGSVTVGTGSGTGAFLTPGVAAATPSTLTIQKRLTFRADGTFHFGFKSSNITADKIIARGVTLDSGALIFFDHVDVGTFPLGTVFTAIDNTAATPITGTFANLADGATFTIDNTTFQADYQGGDGNDLTLTVVP
jgi:hypothetical protein